MNGGALSRTDRAALIKLDRRHLIGGSDARIIMGKDEKALLRLWRQERGEEAPADLSSVPVVQLSLATEDLCHSACNIAPLSRGIGVQN